MMVIFQPDSSGINSLGGFSYQIRVFAYYMTTLNEGMQIEFETIDDVNIKSRINPKEIDDYDESFVNKIVSYNSNIAIQVKRTNITDDVSQKVLLNWILLEYSNVKVGKYILFTDEEYQNTDSMFKRTSKEQFDLIIKSKKNVRATISKVKSIFGDDFEAFEKLYKLIQSKYEFVSIENIDQKIAEEYSKLFRRTGVNEMVFYNRIRELLQHVTVQIIESIYQKKPYIFSYEKFMALIEDISNRMTEQITLPEYIDFKRLHSIDFNSLEIASSREYKQLIACELTPRLVEQHLIFGAYYKNLRFMYIENNKLNKIQNLEETTYENFENVKFSLKKNNKDTPYNRLEETKKLSNSYADNEQIRYGSGIYLTKEEIENTQVSWKDEEDE